jgi:hypothetical protein
MLEHIKVLGKCRKFYEFLSRKGFNSLIHAYEQNRFLLTPKKDVTKDIEDKVSRIENELSNLQVSLYSF